MKKTIFPILALLLLAGCTSTKQEIELPVRPEISWEVFQKIKGSKSTKTHEELVNEYLDSWCGSVEEEKAFMDLGIELY